MKYEIKQLNDTDAVVIGTGREEIKENTNTFKEGFNGDWFWCAKYNKIANNGDITAFDFKVIATIAPFKIEGLPMLELPNPAYDWFASKTYLEQHSLSDKYFESRNPSLLTNEQVTEMYKLELPNQEEDVEKLAMDYLDRTYSLSYERTTWQKLHEKTFIAGYKAAQKQYSEADMRDTCYRMCIPHIKSCIKHITATHKPNDKIYGYKAETWCKEMSKELNNRKIAQLENLKTDLSAMNKQLLAQFNACNDEIKLLKENNNKWDKYPF